MLYSSDPEFFWSFAALITLVVAAFAKGRGFKWDSNTWLTVLFYAVCFGGLITCIGLLSTKYDEDFNVFANLADGLILMAFVLFGTFGAFLEDRRTALVEERRQHAERRQAEKIRGSHTAQDFFG